MCRIERTRPKKHSQDIKIKAIRLRK